MSMKPLEISKILEISHRRFDAWNNRDADTIAAAYAENATFTHPGLPEPLVGGQAVAEYVKNGVDNPARLQAGPSQLGCY